MRTGCRYGRAGIYNTSKKVDGESIKIKCGFLVVMHRKTGYGVINGKFNIQNFKRQTNH
ncbi:hypothetical protein AGMMS49936_09900 [Endomicrobiia bacterium]|nr:hypothetical protein AGMMS49936_09900 [Endomicrobiia bacterium]